MQKRRISNFGWFSFFANQANFRQTALFWHEKHRYVIVSVDLRLFARNKVCKNSQHSFGDLLFNEKQNKPFVSLSVISHTMTTICYFCFVGTSDCCAVRNKYEFVLLGHRFETRLPFFFICFSAYFKNQNIYLKKTGSQSC